MLMSFMKSITMLTKMIMTHADELNDAKKRKFDYNHFQLFNKTRQ